MRLVLKKVLPAVVALAAGLVLTEVLLATLGLLDPRAPIHAGERVAAHNDDVDELVGWKMPPLRTFRWVSKEGEYDVSYESNARGFRGPLTAAEGEARLVFLGDSFTFGFGVSEADTFVHRVGETLPSTACFNFGMSGFGVDQMWLTLRHYALDLHPDLVILAFISDDLTRSQSAYRHRDEWMEKPLYGVRGGRLVELTAEDAPPPALHWIQQNSRIVQGARRLVRSLSNRFPIGSRWKLNRALFEQIRYTTVAAGSELLVVHVSRRPKPMLAGEFEAMGIEFLDLAPDLAREQERLYFRADPHWNPEGHRFVARALSDHLMARGQRRDPDRDPDRDDTP